MVDWSDFTFPPINLWNAPLINNSIIKESDERFCAEFLEYYLSPKTKEEEQYASNNLRDRR